MKALIDQKEDLKNAPALKRDPGKLGNNSHALQKPKTKRPLWIYGPKMPAAGDWQHVQIQVEGERFTSLWFKVTSATPLLRRGSHVLVRPRPPSLSLCPPGAAVWKDSKD